MLIGLLLLLFLAIMLLALVQIGPTGRVLAHHLSLGSVREEGLHDLRDVRAGRRQVLGHRDGLEA